VTAPPTNDGAGAPARILVVEDSATQAAALAVLLERAGHLTVVARRAERALELLGAERIDLVLSDVVMPQLSGPEFAEFLSTTSPELPLIFMTGYSNYPITTESGERRIANHRAIMKPFRPNVLLSTVREVLDSTGRERTLPL
jgi:DNA-binding NtrC family response regulator